LRGSGRRDANCFEKEGIFMSMDGCNGRIPKDSDTEALALLEKKFTELVGVSV
jgi:hypothetical protein